MGFLGQHLIARLLEEGVEVSVLCRSRSLYPTPVWAPHVRWFELDRPGSLESNLLAAVSHASVVYNFAGSSGAVASMRQPQHSLDENCRAQLAFLGACEKSGHRPHVVFPSSWLVYAAGGAAPLHENHPTGPLSVYAAHKICIEHYLGIYAAQGCITYAVCRISNPYGFDDPVRMGKGYKILNAFIQLALAKKPVVIFGDGKQLRDFIYIDDLIEAMLACGLNVEARNQIFNISSGQSHSLIQALETLVELAGAFPVVFKPWPAEYRAVEPGDYIADISKAADLLRFHPRYDLKSGLEETILDYRSAPSANLSLAEGAGD